MKRFLQSIGIILAALLLTFGVAHAATILFPSGGGTGWGTPGGIKAHTVVLGNDLNPVSTTSPSTSGFVLTSNGVNADPTFQAITSGAAYPFSLTGNATSTKTQFNGGLTAFASTTIGAGGQTTGLTISGGATTTLNAYFASNVGVGTTSPFSTLSVTSDNGYFGIGPAFIAKTTGGNGPLGLPGYPFTLTAGDGIDSDNSTYSGTDGGSITITSGHGGQGWTDNGFAVGGGGNITLTSGSGGTDNSGESDAGNGVINVNNATFYRDWFGTGGTWIDFPTCNGVLHEPLSGFGTGGPGVDPWIATVCAPGDWFTHETASGDIAYRKIGGKILIGTGGSYPTLNFAIPLNNQGIGNLGIGSSSPLSFVNIQYPTASTTLDILTVASSTGATLLKVKPTGNVGIGTTTPDSTLDVNGSVRIEGTGSVVTGSISGAIVGLGCDSVDTSVSVILASTTAFITTPQTYPGDGLNWFSYALNSTTMRTKVCSDITVTPTASLYVVKIIK